MHENDRTTRHRLLRSWMVGNGITGADIARKAGVTRQMVSHVVVGRCRSPKVESAFLAAGVPKHLLPPERSATGTE